MKNRTKAPKRAPQKTEARFNFRCPLDLAEKVERKAREKMTTPSQIIRWAVSAYFETAA